MGAAARRILVVEDDQLIREMLCDALGDEGYEVRTATSGDAALALLQDWTPELILLDLMMPGLDGWGFREQQRRLGLAPRARLVVLSARHNLLAQAEALKPVAIFSKPFDLLELLETIQRLAGACSAR
jgi:CheY-like chemotaxis protein